MAHVLLVAYQDRVDEQDILKNIAIEQLYFLLLTTEKKWWPYLSMNLQDYRADVYNDRSFQWLKAEIEKTDCNNLFHEYIAEFQPWPFHLKNNQYFAVQGDGTFYLKGNEQIFDELSPGEKILFNIYARLCKVDFLCKKVSLKYREIPVLLACRHFYFKPKGNTIFAEPDTFLSLIKMLRMDLMFVGYSDDVTNLMAAMELDNNRVSWIKRAINKLRLFLKSEVDRLFTKISLSDYVIVDVLQNKNQEIIKIQAVKEDQGEPKVFEKNYGIENPLSKDEERYLGVSNIQLRGCLKFDGDNSDYYEFIQGKKILVYDLFGGNVIPSRSTLKKLFGDHEWVTFSALLNENDIPMPPYIESGIKFITQALNLLEEKTLNACFLYQFIKNDAQTVLEEKKKKKKYSHVKYLNGSTCLLKRKAGAESKLFCRLCRYQTAKDLKKIPEIIKENVPKIKKEDREFIKIWRLEEKEIELRKKIAQHMCGLGYVYNNMLHRHFGICSAKEQLLFCWLEEQGYKKTINMNGSKCLLTESDIEDIKNRMDKIKVGGNEV